jgi:hypothetical protein
MTRILLAAGALAVLAPVSLAGETAVRLNVQPMAASKPALKYQLLPEVRELTTGNPAQYYLRCFCEQHNFFFSNDALAERARYRSIPLAKLPAEQLRHYGGRGALGQADEAARMDALDWQIGPRLTTEGLGLVLPELGPLRILAEALQVRFRAQVAGRHFDEAIGTAKTMFALARHLGEHPTPAANLLGLSVADLALDTLEEMVQQPGCPNLYWALTDLPCPLVDLRKGFQGHRTMVMADLRPLRDDSAMTGDELEEVVSRLSGRIGFAREQAGETPRNLRAAVRAQVKDADKVRALRQRLTEAATADARTAGEGIYQRLDRALRIQKFPDTQVVLLDEKRAYEGRLDAGMKILALAPWQIDAVARSEKPESGGDSMLADLLPNVLKVRWAQGRLEQRVALLRHVEALRLYASARGGRLPAKLPDVAVPLPDDPFTGKPFRYRVEGAAAQLRGGSPKDGVKGAAYNVHLYEVTVRR